MRRRVPTLFAVLVLLLTSFVTVAVAGTSPPGVNIRWDQCFADGGLMYRTFACDTNAGSERLMMSLELDAPKSDVTGIEFVVSIRTVSPTLPAWWAFRNAGTCRQTSLTLATTLPPGPATCVDWGSGGAVGGISAYNIGSFGANTARIVGAVAVLAAPSLVPGSEYFFGAININHQKTVGTGSCAGCDVPTCIVLDYAKLVTPIAANNIELTYAANYAGSRMVGWQNGLVTDFHPPGHPQSAPALLFPSTFNCVIYDVTESRKSTWGAVKSLYR